VDSGAARAVDRSRNTAPRGVNQPYRNSFRGFSKVSYIVEPTVFNTLPPLSAKRGGLSRVAARIETPTAATYTDSAFISPMIVSEWPMRSTCVWAAPDSRLKLRGLRRDVNQSCRNRFGSQFEGFLSAIEGQRALGCLPKLRNCGSRFPQHNRAYR